MKKYFFFSSIFTAVLLSFNTPCYSYPDTTAPIGVIELRNYVIKDGKRDAFIDYFEKNFITPQEALTGYILGQYRVDGAANNFCWIRGFENMQTRSEFLPAFYYGDTWKKHKNVANAMLANNDNVYLLRPMQWRSDSLEPATSIDGSRVVPRGGLLVVDFYISNTRLNELLPVFAKHYFPLLNKCGVNNWTTWTSVLQENDFPRLPVFQDKNLLVMMTAYKNESEYRQMQKKIAANTTSELKVQLQDVITVHHTMILYPTENTLKKFSPQTKLR